uniref:Uncharacterized protein n=1 Tax=Romanomermis culicivorax TaxID=13658 RepID=A0A915KNK3_ROMCU
MFFSEKTCRWALKAGLYSLRHAGLTLTPGYTGLGQPPALAQRGVRRKGSVQIEEAFKSNPKIKNPSKEQLCGKWQNLKA